MNEAQTEFDHIDPALKRAGWGEGGSRIRKQFPVSQGRILGKGRKPNPLKADYVLQCSKIVGDIIQSYFGRKL